ncbi:MAG: hypothetical protein ABF315_08625, partial [Lentimonas sp.]
ETWIPAKLLTDHAGTSSLSLGTSINPPKAFFRLSLEGDPDSARLRADDDGDKIINLLEANAGEDAFETASSGDDDNDGIPDYWEQFHFQTLDHDGSYVDTAGGLTLTQAYAAGTDPKTIDSDGDGESDLVEITNGTNQDYDETRDDPNGDYDGDGLTNAQEHAASTFPKDDDSDDDNVKDGEDSWPRDEKFIHAPASESYALIDLSGANKLPHPVTGSYDGETFSVQVDDFSGVLLSYATVEATLGTTTTRNLVNKYYNWNGVLDPPAFNGNKTAAEVKPHSGNPAVNLIINNLFRAHLTRSGIIQFIGEFGYESPSLHAEEDATFVTELKAAYAPSNAGFNTQNPGQAVTTLSDSFLDPLIAGPINWVYINVQNSEYSDTPLLYVEARQSHDETAHQRVASLVKDGTKIYTGIDDENLGDSVNIYNYSGSGIGNTGTAVYKNEGDPNKYALISDTGTVDTLPLGQGSQYGVISMDGEDVLASDTNEGPKAYSLDKGASTHPSMAWNPNLRKLEAVSFIGKSSEELIILQSNQTGILINGTIKTADELLGDQAEGWTDVKLDDINSNGMIVGTALHSPQGGTPARKVVALLKVDVAVDGNRDGEIGFASAADKTTEEEPFEFWLNNDNDQGLGDDANDNEPLAGQEDYLNSLIDGHRDLEDFARLHLGLGSIFKHLKDGSLELKFAFSQDGLIDTPAVNIWGGLELEDDNGGTGYLEDHDTAVTCYVQSLNNAPWRVTNNTAVEVPTAYWQDFADDTEDFYFLFEGAGEGLGHLVLELHGNGQKLGEASGVWLDLKDIEDMYEHFFVGNIEGMSASSINAIDPADVSQSFVDSHFKYDSPEEDEEEDYILFVHGWRMLPWEKVGYAETSFKRLYWQGYKGRFGTVSWPTEHTPRLEWVPGGPPADVYNYYRSERKARLSSEAVRSLLLSLNSRDSGAYNGRVRAFAHSMGNVVLSETFRNHDLAGGSPLVETYVASQAASTAHGYDQARPELMTNVAIATPNLHAQFPVGSGSTEPYYFRIDSAAPDIVNFHNYEDVALSGWELAKYFKPTLGYGWGELPDGAAGWTTEKWWYRGIIIDANPAYLSGAILQTPFNRYEILAMAADSHSKALGAAVYSGYNVGGPIDESRNVDLNSQFSFGDDHSAQFLSSNIKRKDYWLELLRNFGLAEN